MYPKLLLAGVIFFFVTSISAQQYVTLYEDCNYQGRSYFLEPGNYRSYQMKIDNDRLSGIQIPNGMRITIYEHDDFKGKSKTFTSTVSCLDNEWNDMASSLSVESTLPPGYNPNDYVIFYNDCYSNGYSRSIGPGTYTAAQLGLLRENISSFTIFGNLQVKVYTASENATGYSYTFEQSQSCLGGSYNDKIKSLVIEYRPAGGGNYGAGNAVAAFYTDCHFRGNSIHLVPGYYPGDKLGLFRYDISSVEIPSNLRVKVFLNNENLSGSSYTLTENQNCLSYSLNDRIGSLVVEDKGYGGNYGNYPPGGNQQVIIFVDENYKGQSVAVLPGTYSNMAMLGFPDNALSSLQVPVGYRVVLYEYENFGGKSYTITESKNRFYLSGWSDKTSSIAVYRDR
jgi:hypothetical protein